MFWVCLANNVDSISEVVLLTGLVVATKLAGSNIGKTKLNPVSL